MKKRMFKNLQEDEKRAKLLLALVLKTKGRVEESELEDLVNNIDVDNQFRINTYTNSKEFQKKTNLEDFEVDRWQIYINDSESTINIYLPEGEGYMISKRVQYILDNFNVKRSNNI